MYVLAVALVVANGQLGHTADTSGHLVVWVTRATPECATAYVVGM